MEKRVFIALLIILILLSVSSSAKNHKESKVMVDEKIESALSADEEVNVIIMTKGKNNEKTLSSVPRLKREFSSFSGFTAKISKKELESLKNDPYVFSIVFDNVRHITLSQSAGIVNATKVWGLLFNSTNITGKYETACIIDTGINYSHANMGGCTLANFTGGNCSKVLSGYDFINADNDPMDDHSHGTHVAGIISSTDLTYRGIAPDAAIVALKACNSAGECADSDITASIDWCVYNASKFNISVISMSLGGGSYTSFCDGSETAFATAIDAAIVKNISAVVSTGNEGSASQISAPACIKNATSVSSTTKADAISSFSNRNNVTDLFAPGTSITSLNYQGGTKTLSGTSMAAPHASGAFLLIKQYMKTAYNNSTISPYDIQSNLNLSGVLIDDTSGSGYNFSRIDVFSAIKRLDKFPPNITLSSGMLANSTNTSNTFIFVNITTNEILSAAILELDNGTKANYTMAVSNITLLNWNINQSASFGSFTYKVYGNDSINWGVSQKRTININNTAPVITFYIPNASSNISIAEPSNQSFNITVSDLENFPAISWYVNSSLAKNSGNFTFVGNYSTAGEYNITVIVSDGDLDDYRNWTLKVNNTNRIPVLNFSNQTLPEDTNITFVVSATDSDNETLTYSINDSRFTINSTNGTINFTPDFNFNGMVYLNITATDNTDNASGMMFVNITPVNDAPLLTQIQNLSFNETDWANFTLSAGDVENDTLIFAVNDSKFSQSGNNSSWKTNLTDSGDYHIKANVSDSNLSDSKTFIITVIDRFDSDNDGNPDIYDNDDDNDGIPDDIDNLTGNLSSVLSGTLAANVTIDNSTSLVSFNGSRAVELKDRNVTLISFSFNFSRGILNLANISYEKQKGFNATGFLLVKGVFLQEKINKTIFVDDINSTIDTICLKDAEIESISNISASCNSTNETLIKCDSTQQGSYNCSLDNAASKYQITGLRFSGVIEQCADNDNDTYYVSGCGSGNDCNDNNKGINPDASEICGNGIDENCDNIDTACPVSPSSGGGGGGGGGGGSAKPASAKASQFYNIVSSSEKTLMRTRNNAFSVSQIIFAPKEQLSSLTLSIELVNSSKIASPIKNPYQYFNITLNQKSDLEYAEIYFAVNKSWFEQSDFDEDKVKLLRLSSSWESYSAIKINESSLQHHYYSQVPDFSVFAITALKKEILEAEAPEAKNLSRKGISDNLAPEQVSSQVQPAATEGNGTQLAGRADEASGRNHNLLIAVLSLIIFMAFAVLLFLVLFLFLKQRKRVL